MGTYIPMGWAVTDQIVNDMQHFNFNMVVHAGKDFLNIRILFIFCRRCMLCWDK